MLLRNKRPLIGITFSIVSVFLGLASGLLIKKVSIEANLITTLFYRFVFSVPLLLLFAVYTAVGQLLKFRKKRRWHSELFSGFQEWSYGCWQYEIYLWVRLPLYSRVL